MTLLVSPRDLARGDRGVRPMTGALSGFQRSFETAYRRAMLEDRSDSAIRAYQAAYDAYSDAIRQRTGRYIRNPVRGSGAAELFADQRQRFHDQVDALAADYPDLPMLSPDDIDAQIANEARTLRQEMGQDVGVGFSGLGEFLGTASALITDPVALITLPLGGPVANVARAGLMARLATIGGFAAREAGIAAATEIAIQPLVAAHKDRIGVPHTLEDALFNVSVAGLGGGVIGGAVATSVTGARLVRASRRSGRRPPDIRAAELAVDSADAVDAINPYEGLSGARRNLTQTQAAARRLRNAGAPDPTERASQEALEAARRAAPTPELREDVATAAPEPDVVPEPPREPRGDVARETPADEVQAEAAAAAEAAVQRADLTPEQADDAAIEQGEALLRERDVVLTDPERVDPETGQATNVSARELAQREVDRDAALESLEVCLR